MELTSLIALNERYMVDTCTIRRDPQLEKDDTWNDVTGEYTEPAGDKDIVYTGKCMFYPDRAFQEDNRGGQVENLTGYWLEVPVSTTGLKPEDEVTCNTSKWDPALVGRKFYLDAWEGDTYATARRVRVHDRQRKP